MKVLLIIPQAVSREAICKRKIEGTRYGSRIICLCIEGAEKVAINDA